VHGTDKMDPITSYVDVSNLSKAHIASGQQGGSMVLHWRLLIGTGQGQFLKRTGLYGWIGDGVFESNKPDECYLVRA